MSISTTHPLRRRTPEAEGISSGAILDFIDALEEHQHPLDAVHSFMLLRHGNVVAEGWWAPYRVELPHMLYSLSKSFTSSAIGIAVNEGLLCVDDPVLQFFPDDAPANPSDHLRAMTVKHLLSMNTGHHEDTVAAVWGGSDDNWPRAFLAQPVQHEPGTWFVYNTAATYMLSVIITRLTGETLIDYLRPRLFDPLGIEHPVWDTDPRGLSLGWFGTPYHDRGHRPFRTDVSATRANGIASASSPKRGSMRQSPRIPTTATRRRIQIGQSGTDISSGGVVTTPIGVMAPSGNTALSSRSTMRCWR